MTLVNEFTEGSNGGDCSAFVAGQCDSCLPSATFCQAKCETCFPTPPPSLPLTSPPTSPPTTPIAAPPTAPANTVATAAPPPTAAANSGSEVAGGNKGDSKGGEDSGTDPAVIVVVVIGVLLVCVGGTYFAFQIVTLKRRSKNLTTMLEHRKDDAVQKQQLLVGGVAGAPSDSGRSGTMAGADIDHARNAARTAGGGGDGGPVAARPATSNASFAANASSSAAGVMWEGVGAAARSQQPQPKRATLYLDEIAGTPPASPSVRATTAANAVSMAQIDSSYLTVGDDDDSDSVETNLDAAAALGGPPC